MTTIMIGKLGKCKVSCSQNRAKLIQKSGQSIDLASVKFATELS